LLRLLPMVDVNFLGTCDIAGAGAHSATEYHIQAAVLVAASKVCPRGTFLNEWPIGNLRLDFLYIHDETNRWGFEITRNGADVDGHMKRFDDGPYAAACSDWLVVDFCTNPSPPAPSKPKLVRISPHPCIGWDAFTVSFDSKTVYVPRNGIPHHLVVDDVKPCVETVELRPGSVWVQQLTSNSSNVLEAEGDSFLVEGKFDCISTLKQDIKRMEELQCPLSRLKIFAKEDNGWKQQQPQWPVSSVWSYGYLLPEAPTA